jgi:hypothetical protein
MRGIIVIPADKHVGATRRVALTQRATQRVPPTGRSGGPAPGSIGAIVGQFKSAVAKRINRLRATPGLPLWQRNYYEHIIDGDEEWAEIVDYITSNPGQWAADKENPLPRATRRVAPTLTARERWVSLK